MKLKLTKDLFTSPFTDLGMKVVVGTPNITVIRNRAPMPDDQSDEQRTPPTSIQPQVEPLTPDTEIDEDEEAILWSLP